MARKVRFCQRCKDEGRGLVEIAAERVASCPDTRLCSDCAKTVAEKHGGEFIVTAKQTSLGKTQSLKKNYGDVTTQKIRRELHD